MTEETESGPDKALNELAEFVGELEYETIPDDVVMFEKRHVLDTLGCILFGSTTPWIQKIIHACERLGERGDASVLGDNQLISPARAALINGTASHAMDFDDHCQEAGLHAGSATVPTALAFAETTKENISGKTFLTAIIAGIEVGIRSGYGIGYGSVSQGWHIAGWTGAFASAATIGKLNGLDHLEQCHALAIAGTQGCGLLGAQYGAEVKRFHMGKAAEAGYLGAVLAGESFTGDLRIFEERYGAIGTTMSDDYDIKAVVEGIGDRFRIQDKLTLKPFPSVGQVHAPVDAVRELLRKRKIDPAAVSSVRIRVTPTVKDHVGWEYKPTDVMSAQANIQYAIATLLSDGKVTVDAYTEQAIRREKVLDRINDVNIVVDDELQETTFGSVVEVTCGDDTYENVVHTPRGYPDNPMTDTEIKAKFRNQASKALSPESVNRLIELVENLENLDDVSEIVNCCRPDA